MPIFGAPTTHPKVAHGWDRNILPPTSGPSCQNHRFVKRQMQGVLLPIDNKLASVQRKHHIAAAAIALLARHAQLLNSALTNT
jgi:hypothetical protein